MAVESVEAAAESSILPGNNQNMDPNTIRSGMDVAAEVRVPEELPPVLVAVAVGEKERDCMETEKVDTYRKREEGQWCNNMQVGGAFGNLVKGVHGEQVSTGSYRWDDQRDGGARKF